MTERTYRVGGHLFSIVLEEPWTFMNYTAPVAERIRRAAAGEVLPIVPTRAGDEVPARTYVQHKAELPADMSPTILDFSQYEPFFCETPQAPLFRLTIHAGEPQWLAEGRADGSIREIMRVDDRPPFYYIFERDGETFYEFDAARDRIAGTLRISADYREGDYYPKPGFGSYTTLFQISTALMILYTYNTARQQTLLMHASVIRVEGQGYLFLGVSGTGKSTHSRLWLETIEGAELLNDDNPVLRFDAEGRLRVYGTPWSGKTPCYRNVEAPVGAIVRLDQAPRNEIRPLSGIQAYAAVLPGASAVRWDRSIMDALTATVERIALGTKVFHLDCLPDPDAARTCCAGIKEKSIR